MLAEVLLLRQGGVKLTAAELKGEKRYSGHFAVERGTARLTVYRQSPPTVGDVVPPLVELRLHRLVETDGVARELVLHGMERPRIDGLRVGPPQLQAWWVRFVMAGAVVAPAGT